MRILSHIACIMGAAIAVCSCQNQKYPVFFLSESDTAEAGASFNILHNGTYYNRMPFLSLSHFKNFRSFLNPQDGTIGVVLYVKEEYRTRLYSETLHNVGRKILPVVNGFTCPPLLIDGGINTGKITIWGGLNGYDLRRISETVTPVKPELEEKRYLKDNPRPVPQKPQNATVERDATGRIIPQLYTP